jgi:hypothetical protein
MSESVFFRLVARGDKDAGLAEAVDATNAGQWPNGLVQVHKFS